jgi:VanZ family protein
VAASFLRFVRVWLPALVWLGVIAYESFGLPSSVTGSLLRDFFTRLHIYLPAAPFDFLHQLLRKSGHFIGYGILSLLLFRALYYSLDSARFSLMTFRLRCAGLALGGTLLTAVADEWHQSFDTARTGTPKDVALDVAGGATALLLAFLVIFVISRRSSVQSQRATA